MKQWKQIMLYNWKISGVDGNGNSWTTKGSITSNESFLEVVDEAIRQSFTKLTKGLAVYGNPGVGCVGPYKILDFAIGRAR